jgi:hypothetical protein
MKLSRDEEAFLRHWIHDEARYEAGVGAAKRLQVQRGARPAELAIIIAAAIPDPSEQEAAALAPAPADPPKWPWAEESFQRRLAEAKALLASAESPSR